MLCEVLLLSMVVAHVLTFRKNVRLSDIRLVHLASRPRLTLLTVKTNMAAMSVITLCVRKNGSMSMVRMLTVT